MSSHGSSLHELSEAPLLRLNGQAVMEQLLIESLRLLSTSHGFSLAPRLAISPQGLETQLLRRLQLPPGALGVIEVQGSAVLGAHPSQIMAQPSPTTMLEPKTNWKTETFKPCTARTAHLQLKHPQDRPCPLAVPLLLEVQRPLMPRL